LVILTPNAWHYFAVAGRLVPHRLQQVIARRLLMNPGRVFRTYYHANSVSRLATLATRSGLQVVSIRTYEPPPTYMALRRLLFYGAAFYERLVNRYRFLSRFRAQLVALFQKP
jgi:hypothetical protein